MAPGSGRAGSRGANERPWRAFARGPVSVLEDAASGEPIAWFPIARSHIATHPSGRTRGRAAGNHLCLITPDGGGEK